MRAINLEWPVKVTQAVTLVLRPDSERIRTSEGWEDGDLRRERLMCSPGGQELSQRWGQRIPRKAVPGSRVGSGRPDRSREELRFYST